MSILCISSSLTETAILMRIVALSGVSSVCHWEDVALGELRPITSSWLSSQLYFKSLF